MTDYKHAIILNYSMMTGEIFDTMREKADFMRQFFTDEMKADEEIQDLNAEFANFCIALKKFDKLINRMGETLK